MIREAVMRVGEWSHGEWRLVWHESSDGRSLIFDGPPNSVGEDEYIKFMYNRDHFKDTAPPEYWRFLMKLRDAIRLFDAGEGPWPTAESLL